MAQRGLPGSEHPHDVEELPAEQVVIIGAGFLGTRIAAVALQHGFSTLVLTRRPAVDPTLANSGAQIVVGDASEAVLVDHVLLGSTHVVYCAGGRLPTESVNDPAADAAGTLHPLLTVLEALRRRPGARITFLSSGGTVYGRPETEPVREDHPCHPVVPYGVSRLAAEGYVTVYAQLHGVPARILRLGNVYGPGQPADRHQGVVATLLAAARDGTPAPMYGDGKVARDYVHIDDIADVVHRLGAPYTSPEILNVGTGSASTLRDVVGTVVRATGVTLRVDQRPARPFDVERIALATDRLSALIHYAPVGLEEGVRRTWEAQGAANGRAVIAEGV